MPSLDVSAGPSFETMVPMRDGTPLGTDVYLPPGKSAAASPALLMRTPYGKRSEVNNIPQLASYFGQFGFAIVGQDTRGRYSSEGTRIPFSPELEDGYDTLEWISSQPWCDGMIVPIGESYVGVTAWAAAATGHPSVRAAIVRATTCHVGEHWLNQQGVFRLHQNVDWASFAWADRTTIQADVDWSTRPLDDLALEGAAREWLRIWVEHAPDDRWWAETGAGRLGALIDSVNVPILHWGGWWDLFSRGQLQAWRGLSQQRPTDHLLVMGATDHTFTRFPDIEHHGIASVPPIDVQWEQALPFLEALVNREPVAHRATVHWELTHAESREDSSWPPSNARVERLYLADGDAATLGPEGGALIARPDRVRQEVVWTHDGSNLVPSLEPSVWFPLSTGYPDERDVCVRDDVITFTSPEVVEPVDVAGDVTAALRIGSSDPVAEVCVTLSDVYPDGTTWRIVEGASIVACAESLADVVVDLGPVGYRIRPGHRLRFAIAGSSYPRYLPDSATRTGWSASEFASRELRLALGDSSYLMLPVLAR